MPVKTITAFGRQWAFALPEPDLYLNGDWSICIHRNAGDGGVSATIAAAALPTFPGIGTPRLATEAAAIELLEKRVRSAEAAFRKNADALAALQGSLQ